MTYLWKCTNLFDRVVVSRLFNPKLAPSMFINPKSCDGNLRMRGDVLLIFLMSCYDLISY